MLLNFSRPQLTNFRLFESKAGARPSGASFLVLSSGVGFWPYP
jgi:hypothetical protein